LVSGNDWMVLDIVLRPLVGRDDKAL